MKNLVNLGLVLVIAVVLGCKCTTTTNQSNSGMDSPRNNDLMSNSKEQPKGTPFTVDDEDAPPPTVKPTIKTTVSPKNEDETEEEIFPTTPKGEKSPQKDSSDSKIPTMSQYNQINIGMLYDEVTEIIGFEGRLIKKNGNSSRYLWGDENTFVMISFESEKVSFKSQNNLK